MIKKQFKCRLLTDVILSTSAAIEGKRESLNFIPGGCFLGIAASKLYFNGKDTQLSNEDSQLAFHSGKVRFSDAHPIKDGIRTEKIPAAYYHPKLQKESDGCVILYRWKEDPDIQMKQCRNGFYAFDDRNLTAEKIRTDKSVSIKSAYDKEQRRSKDGAMYSYEALCKGCEFAFEVEFDDETSGLEKSICAALCGTRHIGKSKTAEYGLVEIEECAFAGTESHSGQDVATVYADGRLIFLDKNGLPKFTPSAEELGFQKGAVVDWEKTQIRTFQYAPWNAKRQNSDCDRCGIEKGSVFVINLNGTESPKLNAYIGSYRNEGFGKVIYNPEFLSVKEGSNAEVKFKIKEASTEQQKQCSDSSKESCTNNSLVKKLESIKNSNYDAYTKVNEFVNSNSKEFTSGERFASQWGHIRELAERAKTLDELKGLVTDYLGHGVAEDKWRYKKKTLFEFIDKLQGKSLWRESMVNLAAVMAKKCKKN